MLKVKYQLSPGDWQVLIAGSSYSVKPSLLWSALGDQGRVGLGLDFAFKTCDVHTCKSTGIPLKHLYFCFDHCSTSCLISVTNLVQDASDGEQCLWTFVVLQCSSIGYSGAKSMSLSMISIVCDSKALYRSTSLSMTNLVVCNRRMAMMMMKVS